MLLEAELERCARAGRLPKAVVPTDLYGQPCCIDQVVAICDRYGVPVVCDSAEAVGAWVRENGVGANGHSPLIAPVRKGAGEREETEAGLKHAGKGARAAVFSFNGNKIITTSGGGMLASDDRELIEKARFWSQQARDPAPHYEHTEIGYNYRMSNILAAIGLGQLQALDERVKRRREIFETYRAVLEDLPGVSFMPEASYARSSRWLTVMLIDPMTAKTDRETVRLALEAENIESRPVWKPMHMQPVFGFSRKDAKAQRGTCSCRVVGGEVAEEFFERGLCLPSGTAMSNADVERVIGIVIKSFKG